MPKMARTSLLRSVFELAEQSGLDRSHILKEIELDAETASDAAALIPAHKLIDALEYAAAVTEREDFGLVIDQAVGHRSLGAVGVLIENCRTVAEAVAEGTRYLHLHNAALKYTLTPRHDHYVFRAQINARGKYEPRHYIEALLGMSVSFFRRMLGAEWHPVKVTMSHERLGPATAYHNAFGCPVEFGQKMNTVVVRRQDFDRRIERTDPRIKELARSALDDWDHEQGDNVVGEARTVIRSLLPLGKANAGEVARSLSLSPRVLQRRLADAGTTFTQVLKDTRLAIMREQLARKGATVAKIAPILGLSDASAVSRFLREQVGQSAREIRAASRQVGTQASQASKRGDGRLRALQACQILDSPDEPSFERIAHLAHHLAGTSIALISFIDGAREWVKARVGWDVREIPHERSLAALAIAKPGGAFWIADARADTRFCDHALVTGAPRLRFYAAAPIVLASGEAVGVVSVIDRAPHPYDAEADRQLRMLADLASDLLEHRRTAAAHDAARSESHRHAQRVRDGIEAMSDGVIMFDALDLVLMWNSRYLELFPHLAGRVKVGIPIHELAAIAVSVAKTGDDAVEPGWSERRVAIHGNPQALFVQRVAGRVIESVSRPLSDGGSITVHRDITEREQWRQTARRASN